MLKRILSLFMAIVLILGMLPSNILIVGTAADSSDNGQNIVEPTELPENPEHQSDNQNAEQPTEKPTEQPTEQPTEKPTERPTEQPTEKPTEHPTEQPT